MFNRLVKFRRGGDKYEDLDESNIDLDITDPAMKNIVNSPNSMEMSENPEESQPTSPNNTLGTTETEGTMLIMARPINNIIGRIWLLFEDLSHTTKIQDNKYFPLKFFEIHMFLFCCTVNYYLLNETYI